MRYICSKALSAGMLALSAFFLLPAGSGTAMAASLCGDAAPPAVRINIVEEPVSFVTNKNSAELDKVGFRRVSYHPQREKNSYHARIGGLMDGHVSLDHKIRYDRHVNERTGLACISLTAVDVTLRMDPQIYIATEYRNNSCWFREIFKHEARHIQADRQLLEKHKILMKGGLRLLFTESSDYVSGTVPVSFLEQTVARMGQVVENTLGTMFTGMMEDRVAWQRAIDHPHEYVTIAKRC